MEVTPKRTLPSVKRPGKAMMFHSKPGNSPSPMIVNATVAATSLAEEEEEEEEEEEGEEEEEDDDDEEVDQETEEDEEEEEVEVEDEGETLLDDGDDEITEEISDDDEEIEDPLETDAHVSEPGITENAEITALAEEQVPVEPGTGKRKRALTTPTPKGTTTNASDEGDLHSKKPKVGETSDRLMERMLETLQQILALKKEKFEWTKAKYEERKKERLESIRLDEARRKQDKAEEKARRKKEKERSEEEGKRECLLAALKSSRPMEDVAWLSLLFDKD